jgi:hypothetical protein
MNIKDKWTNFLIDSITNVPAFIVRHSITREEVITANNPATGDCSGKLVSVNL